MNYTYQKCENTALSKCKCLGVFGDFHILVHLQSSEGNHFPFSSHLMIQW